MKGSPCLCVTLIVLVSRLSLLNSWQLPRGIHRVASPTCHGAIGFAARSRVTCIKNISSKSFILSSSLNRCDEYAEVLSKPRWGGPIFGPIVRYLNTIMIGVIFSVILCVFNKFTAVRKELLVDKIFHREKGRGLLTVSNHQSMADDPGLFAALIPWWRITSKQMRWVLCTEDIFFFSKWLQMILAGGNVVPLDRSGSLEQPLFHMFQKKLGEGSWCHIFPEGKVRQGWRFEEDEPVLGEFKFGVGKLIAHCETSPIIIPIYHRGMDRVLPEKVLKDKKTKRPSAPISPFPKIGQDIKLFIGESLDFTEKVNIFKEKHPGVLESWRSTEEGIQLYAEITNDIKKAVLKLEAEAWNRQPKILLPSTSPTLAL